ncbi:MAG: CRTAC1 family protein, partial [Deltaproteobacteria bacterium]|nr:CRTAC1 family protein [Deltaproteobacteria bacterium]
SHKDWHGPAWADFDNDGDQDLVVIAGGAGTSNPMPNRLFVNQAGYLQDQAAALGVDAELARGRNPLWWDWNADGRLDLVVTNALRNDGSGESALFEQTDSGFVSIDVLPEDDLTQTLLFAQLGDLSGDGVPELLTISNTRRAYRIRDTSTVPFADLTDTLGLGTVSWVEDAAIADFTGDLLADLFLARLPTTGSDVVHDSPTSPVKLHLNPWPGEFGIDLRTAGDLTIDVAGWFFNSSEVFVGTTGWNPPQYTPPFTVSATDPDNHGLLPHDPGDRGIYIGYNTVSELWEVRVSGAKGEALIESSAAISELNLIGFELESRATGDKLFVQEPGGLSDATVGSGLEAPTECVSVAAGDFDNDMDIDLYMVCKGYVDNRWNLLFENQGGGTFVAVADAGGAAGSSLGRGDSVVTADYDRDGFLDLFVTNGSQDPLFGTGPHQLFRNLGNDNHWIEIDLEGVASNRDGIGARVLLTAGGVTQLREQAGGIHHRCQDHMRLHFGLGSNTEVEQLVVEWPSGAEQQLDSIDADQILHVIEAVPEPTLLLLQLATMSALGLLVRRRRPACISHQVARELPAYTDEVGFVDR